MKFDFLKKSFLVLLIVFYTNTSFAQCINTFPNTQNFESAAVWTSGGNNSDWAWGSPSKPVIANAGGGLKCWVIGGLTTSSYNGSQQSYIESPCYDLSSLTYPIVSFKVFWETEYQYDGASFQYCINNGAWQTVGSANSPNNCNTLNWFNYSNVNFLNWAGSKNGWSGNSKPNTGNCVGGSGSLTWLTSKHCLVGLAGKSNVKFRFVFGSGQTCNGFDGFAMDDFTVENAVITPVTFTNSCGNFTSINTGCSTSLTYTWNFGDPSTGASNTSSLTNPVHVFSNAGVYTVSLSTSGNQCDATTLFTKTVSILGSSITAKSDVSCNGGANGSATVLGLYGSSNLSYTWSPEGGNAATTNPLAAGLYSVFVLDGNGCSSTSTVTINEPTGSTGVSSQTITSCLGNAIVLTPSLSGINDPVTYLWSPGAFTSSSINVNSTANTVYTLMLTITGACPKVEQKLFTNVVVPKPTLSFSNSNSKGCAPLCVDFIDNSSTTSGSITAWNWQFSDGTSINNSSPSKCFTKAGIYKVSYGVANSYGCSNFKDSALAITVFPTPIADFSFSATNFTDLEETTVQFKDVSTEQATKWEWNFAGLKQDTLRNPNFIFSVSGVYPIFLNVINKYGCSASTMRTITVLPEFTFYVPNTFSPNNDGVNDVFMPMGRGWEESSYELTIYNRWGQKIFNTKNVYEGWNGKTTSKDESTEDDVYVYQIQVNDFSKKLHSYTGHVMVIK